MIVQIRVYSNGEIRADFDPREQKIPKGYDAFAKIIGALHMVMLELSGWAIRSASLQAETSAKLKEYLEKLEPSAEVH